MIFYHLSQTLTLTRIYCTTLKLNTIDIGITLPKKFISKQKHLWYEGKDRKEREDDFNKKKANAFFFPESYFLFPFLLFS